MAKDMTEQNVESQDGVEGEGQDANIDYYDGVERRELGWSRGGGSGC